MVSKLHSKSFNPSTTLLLIDKTLRDIFVNI